MTTIVKFVPYSQLERILKILKGYASFTKTDTSSHTNTKMRTFVSCSHRGQAKYISLHRDKSKFKGKAQIYSIQITRGSYKFVFLEKGDIS